MQNTTQERIRRAGAKILSVSQLLKVKGGTASTPLPPPPPTPLIGQEDVVIQ